MRSPRGEVHGLGSGKVGSCLAWDGCWRLLLTNPAGSEFAAMGLRNWKQEDKLSSTLVLLCWPRDEVARPGTWLVAVQTRTAEPPEQAVLKDTAPPPLFTQCWFCVLSNSYVMNTVPEALVKWTVLYLAVEKASLSCTDWACNKRGAEVYASFKFKSQSNRFDSQGWHLIICPTSQVKFRAKFRTSVWTECHDTSVYLLHNMPYEHVMFNLVKNNCTLT